MGDPISDSAVEQITKADRNSWHVPCKLPTKNWVEFQYKVRATLRRLSSTVIQLKN